MASFSCRGVRKSFGTTRVLRGVSVDISDRQFVVLAGPSRRGKATPLRMIARLENVAVFRERHQFKSGDKVPLKPSPRLVHLFDEGTGKRLNV